MVQRRALPKRERLLAGPLADSATSTRAKGLASSRTTGRRFCSQEIGPAQAVRGTVRPELRAVKGLAGVLQRNYDYDRFWVTFPLTREDRTALFGAADRRAQLIVQMVNKEGRVEWPIPASIRGPVQ
jgi:hypothetical protein